MDRPTSSVDPPSYFPNWEISDAGLYRHRISRALLEGASADKAASGPPGYVSTNSRTRYLRRTAFVLDLIGIPFSEDVMSSECHSTKTRRKKMLKTKYAICNGLTITK